MKVKQICHKCEKFERFFFTPVKNSCEFSTDVTNTTAVKDSHELFTSVIRTINSIKNGICNAFIFTAGYLLSTILYRADTKVSVTVEPEFILFEC